MNLYTRWTITERRVFMEKQESMRQRHNWDAHFRRVVRETKKLMFGRAPD